MLGERAKMMVEGSAIPDVQRIQTENASGVIFRRQPFAFVGEQVGAPGVQLLAGHQVAELAQVHEAPNRSVGTRLQAVLIWKHGHLLLLRLDQYHGCEDCGSFARHGQR